MIIGTQNNKFTSTIQRKNKEPIFKTHQQCRSSSLTQSPPSHPKIVNSNTHKQIQSSQFSLNQYYVQRQGNRKNQNQQLTGEYTRNTDFSTDRAHISAQNWQKLKKFFNFSFERYSSQLKHQIQAQHSQIRVLQKALERQSYKIELHNKILNDLTKKLQLAERKLQKSENKLNISNSTIQKNELTMIVKRVDDLEIKLRVIIEQVEEEKESTENQIENLSIKIIQYFGNLIGKSKVQLLKFIEKKQQTIDFLSNILQKKLADSHQQLQFLSIKQIQLLQGIKALSLQKEDCKQSKNSTIKSIVSTCFSNNNCNNMDQSDYFFHPIQTEITTTVKIIEELTKGRGKLPIRVYLDVSGRMKYLQSKTFVFDRKGDFITPTSKDLVQMQRQGWIELN